VLLQQARHQLNNAHLEVNWIDCTDSQSRIVVIDDREPYVTWEGSVDEQGRMGELTARGW
jgi:hypothetical protein